MQDKHKRKIQSIINTLKVMTEDLEEILADEKDSSPSVKAPKVDVEILIKEISTLDRQNTEEYLKSLKQSQLGEIFVTKGGATSDKKKPKIWLIERILWRTFDFKEGHEAIRET